MLAAGGARRFGSPKQLALLDGRPLLEHALLAMAGARLIDAVVVVLGAHADAVLAGVERHGATAVIATDWEEGQAASLRAGVAALADRAEAIVVTLGDQPAIDPRAIDRIAGARDGSSDAIRASYGGRPGHPVLLERMLFERVAVPARRRGSARAAGGERRARRPLRRPRQRPRHRHRRGAAAQRGRIECSVPQQRLARRGPSAPR